MKEGEIIGTANNKHASSRRYFAGDKFPAYRRETLEEKLKLNLAIGLFVSKDISLAKAAQLAEKPLSRFVEILGNINIPTVEYTEDIYNEDLSFIAEYQRENPK